MRVIADEKRIKRRTKVGEIVPLVALAVLLVATVLIFAKPEWMWTTMVLVWVGLLLSLTGSYLAERYVGPLAHHKKVVEALEKLDDNHILLLYTLPVPFVLVEPGGVTTITVSSHGGEIAYRDGHWVHHERLSLFRRLAGQESLRHVVRQAALDEETMRRFLAERLPDVEVPVRGVLLFIHPDAQLEARDAPIPAFRPSRLRRWLRRSGRRDPLPEEVHRRLLEALGIEATA